MSILVTGATGFLGGRICRHILRSNERVVAHGRNRDRLLELQNLGADPLSMDLATPPTCIADIGRIDVVIHCAALSSPWGTRKSFVESNITGTKTVIDLARKLGARRLVHISSPSVYFQFRHQFNLREDQPLPRSINNYAATKAAAEKLVLIAEDLDPIILRPRGIYGAGDTALLPRLIEAARNRVLPRLNNGNTVIDLTHVKDVIAAAIAAVNAPPKPNQRIFNVSGGKALNVYDVAEQAAARAGISIRWRSIPVSVALNFARLLETVSKILPGRPEPLVTCYGIGLFAYSQTLDISAAKQNLAWSPQIDFETGLNEAFGAVT